MEAKRFSQLLAAFILLLVSTNAQHSRGEAYRGEQVTTSGRSNLYQTQVQTQNTNGLYQQQQQQQQQQQYNAPNVRGTPQYNTQSYQQSYYNSPNVEIVSVPLVNSIVLQDRNSGMQGDQPQQNPTQYQVSSNPQLNDRKPVTSVKDRFTASTVQYNSNQSSSEFMTRAPPTQNTQNPNGNNGLKPTKKPTSIDDRFELTQPSDKYALLSRSVEIFSNDLFYELHRTLGENFMISPFSVYTLLMLIAEGAEGESLKQIANALKIDSNLREVRDLFNILNGTLSAPSDGVFLSQFNALITDTNRPIPREYEDNMEKIYKADIIPVDFTNPNAVYNNINSYVSNKTNGQIRKIVRPEDVIKAQLMLLSGIYFQGKWQKVFNRSFTQQEDFFDVAGNKIGRVDMMFQRGSFPYAAVAELEAHLLELPYGNDNTMSMVLVLPRKGAPIANILNNLNTYGMNLVMEELEKARIEYEDDEVEVHLPKFTTNTETNMQQLLENMGILDIFTGSANLSKLSKSNSYYISALVHKTKIQVDEEGTVAAAVSSAIFANKATPPKFLANRPFLYFIIEKRTNLVLFCGQHIKPSQ